VLSLGRVLNLCKVPKQLNPFCIYRLRSLNLYPRSVAPSLGEAMLFVSPVRYVSSNARMISGGGAMNPSTVMVSHLGFDTARPNAAGQLNALVKKLQLVM